MKKETREKIGDIVIPALFAYGFMLFLVWSGFTQWIKELVNGWF